MFNIEVVYQDDVVAAWRLTAPFYMCDIWRANAPSCLTKVSIPSEIEYEQLEDSAVYDPVETCRRKIRTELYRLSDALQARGVEDQIIAREFPLSTIIQQSNICYIADLVNDCARIASIPTVKDFEFLKEISAEIMNQLGYEL